MIVSKWKINDDLDIDTMELEVITKREHIILNFIKSHPNCTKEIIKENLGILHCSRILRKLERDNLIERCKIYSLTDNQLQVLIAGREIAWKKSRSEEQLKAFSNAREKAHRLPQTENQIRAHKLPRTQKQIDASCRNIKIAIEEYAKLGRHVSRYQEELFILLKTVFSDAELEYKIKTNGKLGCRWADIGVPSMKFDFEYDGGKHFQNDKRKSDKRRDLELAEMGWITFRVDKNILKMLRNNELSIIRFKERKERIVRL